MAPRRKILAADSHSGVPSIQLPDCTPGTSSSDHTALLQSAQEGGMAGTVFQKDGAIQPLATRSRHPQSKSAQELDPDTRDASEQSFQQSRVHVYMGFG